MNILPIFVKQKRSLRVLSNSLILELGKEVSLIQLLKIQGTYCMDRPKIPKSPTSRPSIILPPTPQLNRSKSQQKLSSRLEGTPEKRIRLRDYLFIASTSSQRNSEKKQNLKNSILQKQALKSNISALKRNKYGLPNDQMYDIVRNEITKELSSVLSNIQAKVQALNSQQIINPTNEDLNYLYNLKRLISEYIQPAIKEMDDMAFRRNGNLIKEIISMNLLSKSESIKEEKEEDQPNEEKAEQDRKGTLSIMSAIFGGKAKQ